MKFEKNSFKFEINVKDQNVNYDSLQAPSLCRQCTENAILAGAALIGEKRHGVKSDE